MDNFNRNLFLPDVDFIVEQKTKLYRYFTFSEFQLSALSEPYLWFSPLDAFNDAFEGHIVTTLNNDFLSTVCAIEMWDGSNPDPTAARELLYEEFNRDPTAVRNRYFSKYRDQFFHIIEEHRAKGFCCFLSSQDQSILETNQEMMMWGHYANGMRGFRITYDTKLLIESIPDADIYTIQYASTPPTVDVASWIYQCTSQISWPRVRASSEQNLFQLKHSAWSYESEVRLRRPTPGKCLYDPNAITNVDFGFRMPAAQKKVIQLILAEHGISVSYRIANISQTSFDIHYHPL